MSLSYSSFALVVAFSSSLLFATESLLMTKLYRSIDPVIVGTLRGLSFAISMLPLFLIGAPQSAPIVPALPVLGLGAVATILGNFAYGKVLRVLPLGIAVPVLLVVISVVTLLWGYFVFSEVLQPLQFLSLLVMVIGLVSLKAQRAQKAVFDAITPLGMRATVILLLISGVLMGVGNSFMAMGARSLHPFVAGYIWDVGAGIVGLCIALLTKREVIMKIKFSMFLQILLYCSPAAIAVGCFAYASAHGPVGVVNSVITCGMVALVALGGKIFYKEHLSLRQWSGIVLICVGLWGVK